MQKADNSDTFRRLRRDYAVFEYESFSMASTPEGLLLEFSFNLDNKYTFRPSSFFPYSKLLPGMHNYIGNNPDLVKNIAFHIGMIELISYWKASCAPVIRIKPAALTTAQIQWWKHLYYNGMGEFFYMNSIPADPETFVEIIAEGSETCNPSRIELRDEFLIPLGGGKDSVVTLELLRQGNRKIVPLIMNPRGATIHTAEAAGFTTGEVLTIQRKIDPLLLTLNEQGFLNGHTPFSAMLAFYTLMASLLSGCRNIALSNESSANEATVPGTNINHQYSKSYEFESAFRQYYSSYISPDFNYFSYLRPVGELQIARIFSSLKEYHKVFRSCNAGSKTDSWCGACPKCLFTAIIVSPYAGLEKTADMLGHDILNKPEMQQSFDELCGIAEIKPFECVGTTDEVNAALQMILNTTPEEKLPLLLKRYANIKGARKTPVNAGTFSDEHFVPEAMLNLLKEALQ